MDGLFVYSCMNDDASSLHASHSAQNPSRVHVHVEYCLPVTFTGCLLFFKNCRHAALSWFSTQVPVKTKDLESPVQRSCTQATSLGGATGSERQLCFSQGQVPVSYMKQPIYLQ